jgi:hypothetical protein
VGLAMDHNGADFQAWAGSGRGAPRNVGSRNVGSAIVDIIAKGIGGDGVADRQLSVKVLEFVKSLAAGVRGAKK